MEKAKKEATNPEQPPGPDPNVQEVADSPPQSSPGQGQPSNSSTANIDSGSGSGKPKKPKKSGASVVKDPTYIPDNRRLSDGDDGYHDGEVPEPNPDLSMMGTPQSRQRKRQRPSNKVKSNQVEQHQHDTTTTTPAATTATTTTSATSSAKRVKKSGSDSRETSAQPQDTVGTKAIMPTVMESSPAGETQESQTTMSWFSSQNTSLDEEEEDGEWKEEDGGDEEDEDELDYEDEEEEEDGDYQEEEQPRQPVKKRGRPPKGKGKTTTVHSSPVTHPRVVTRNSPRRTKGQGTDDTLDEEMADV